MLRQWKTDLRYAWHSKLVFGMLLFFFAAALLTFYMNDQQARSEYKFYQHKLEFYRETGSDVEAELEEGYTIIEDNGNSGTVKNPLAYHHAMLGAALYTMQPAYALSLVCESASVFFPILASFFGLVWSASDQKYKTLRHRVQRLGKQKSLWCKQLSGFSLLIALLLLTLPIALCIQAWFRSRFMAACPLEPSDFTYTSPISVHYWKQLLFAAATLAFYYEFGYTFGHLLKGNPISLVVVCVYVLFLPPLFKYDICNVFNAYAKGIFEFAGPFSLTVVPELSLLLGSLELIALFALMLLGNALLTKFRSAYV